MSFILDALKKSEAERQRQAGPALMEVRVIPPKRRFPFGWVALSILLGANLWVLVWLMLRNPSSPPASTAAAAHSAAPVAPAAPASMGSVAPALAAAQPPPPDSVAAAPVAGAALDGGVGPAPSGGDFSDGGDAPNPADFAPALTNPAGIGGLPNYVDVAANVPQLRLDLHVYADKPADRYALVNMHKVHEGDVLPEGPRVREITRDGVVLRYQGSEFLLSRE